MVSSLDLLGLGIIKGQDLCFISIYFVSGVLAEFIKMHQLSKSHIGSVQDLKLLQYSVSFPSLGIIEIIASFQHGGKWPSLRVLLKEAAKRGITSSFKVLYHSDGNPSPPGVLFVLSLDKALDNSSSV